MSETRSQSELKREYAAQLLLNGDDAFKAAFLTTSETGLALQIAGPLKWATDLEVLREKERLLKSGEAINFLANKEIQAKDIYKIATDDKQVTEDRLKAHRLYAELMGHIEKPTAGVTNNILNQGVMVIREAGDGSDEDWEEKAQRQQKTLTGHVI